jgi:hypothetical protein
MMRRVSAALVFVFALVALWTALPAQGLTDDDRYYHPAGVSYVSWVGDLFAGKGALSQKGFDRRFKPNREHPPFAKYVMGTSHAVLHRGLGVFNDLDGSRAGVSLLAALLCAVLVLWLWEPLGPAPAVLAPLMLLSLPRFFFHSQVATLDVPVATMVVLTCASFFWAERSKRWAIACGFIFGLALLTKLNAPFAAVPALVYAIALRWRGFRVVDGSGLRIPPIPRSLIAMALIGPVVFLALWPWLWFAPADRFAEYVTFHLKHYPIYLFYEGEIFNKPFAPARFPFEIFAAVTPLPLLVLGGLGLLESLRALGRVLRFADDNGDVPGVSLRDKLLAFVLLQAFVAIGVVAFSNVPKYGGAKLFMPFFPLWCVLAAAGVTTIARAAVSILGERELRRGPRKADAAPVPRAARPARRAVFAAVVVGALAAVPGFIGTARFHGGFALSYYAETVGGLPGATARGFERTYYDIADKELAAWLAKNAVGKRVHFEPNHKEYVATYRQLKRDGLVPRQVNLVGKRAQADLLVLTHERRWSTYSRLLHEHRKLRLVYEKRIDGVPLYSVYAR